MRVLVRDGKIINCLKKDKSRPQQMYFVDCPYIVRVALCKEIDLPIPDNLNLESNQSIREKVRYSYVNDAELFSLDLTHVITTYGKQNKEESYEVEIELLPKSIENIRYDPRKIQERMLDDYYDSILHIVELITSKATNLKTSMQNGRNRSGLIKYCNPRSFSSTSLDRIGGVETDRRQNIHDDNSNIIQSMTSNISNDNRSEKKKTRKKRKKSKVSSVGNTPTDYDNGTDLRKSQPIDYLNDDNMQTVSSGIPSSGKKKKKRSRKNSEKKSTPKVSKKKKKKQKKNQ